jgi:hypothetical protein
VISKQTFFFTEFTTIAYLPTTVFHFLVIFEIARFQKKHFNLSKRFGGAACQSSSFHWPLSVSGETAAGNFFFYNVTMKSHLEDRLPQRILIDAGELEEHPVFQVRLVRIVTYYTVGFAL